jgi:hypothetical protein
MDGKRVVFENYPVDRLPEEIRENFDAGDEVMLTVEARRKGPPVRTIADILEASRRHWTLSGDPVERVRALRDSKRRDELHARIRRSEKS